MNEEYLVNLYSWINSQDPTFKEDLDIESFKKKMLDDGYAKNMYDWIGSIDNTFSEEMPYDSFSEKVGLKKKDGSESPSEGGSLDSQTTNQPSDVLTPGIDDTPLRDTKDLLEKNKEARQEATRNTFMAGMSTFNNMLVSIPAGIQDIGGFLTTPISMLMGKEAASSEGLKDYLGVDKTLSDYYKEEQERYKGESKEASKVFMQDYEAGIMESIEKGNYSDALDKTFLAGLESAPVSLAMMAGGSTVSLPTLVAGSTAAFFEPALDELRKERPEAGNAQNVIGALTMAGAESVFSSINAKAMSSVYKSIIKKEGLEAGTQVFKKTLLERLTAAMAKYGAPVAALSEGLEEVATLATQNAVKGKPIFEGAADAFIVGAAMGGVMTSPINAAKAVDAVNGAIDKIDQKKVTTDIIERSKYKDVVDAFSERNTKKLDSDQLDFMSLSKSESILKDQVKQKIKDGDLTKEDGEAIINRFNESMSINSQFEGLELSADQKTKLSSLIKEKKSLENKIKGKDQNLVKKDINRINKINEEIQGISEENTQKYFIGAREMDKASFVKAIGDMSQETFNTSEVRVENDQEVSELIDKTFLEQPVEEATEVETPKTERETLEEALGEGPKFQKDLEGDTDQAEVEDIVVEMNKTPEEKASFDVPSDLTTKEKPNIGSLVERFKEKVRTIKDIASLEGVPFIFTISDQLTSGQITNPFTGATMDVKGGIGFNMTEGNEGNAWANTTEAEANNMLGRAQEVYSKNKPLFDRLWKEGKLPNGHIPMAVVKMGQTSIKSNEALFRFASETFKSKFSKAKRKAAKDGLIEDLKNAKGISQEVIDFVAKHNTIDEVLDNIKELNISKRPDITRFVFTGDVKLGAETKPGKPKSKTGEALVGDNKEAYKYVHLQTINSILSDPATSNIPDSHVVSVVGVDVLNPQVTSVDHQNYPFGVKGQLIGVLENPVHAADVFPEMYSKSFYLQKENKAGKPTPPETAVRQSVAAGGAIAGIKAFRGAKMSTKMDTMKKLLGKLKLAFPSVTIVETQQEFDQALSQPNVFKFVKKGEVVYGFTMDGKVFLNPSLATANTAIHEFGHVWMNFLKETNPSLLKKGYELLEGTDILARKIVEYGDTELAREEAIAELMGNKGETIVEAGFKSKFKNWLNAVFTYIKGNTKGFSEMDADDLMNMTLEDFVDGSLNAILQGKEITAKEIKSVGVNFQKGNVDIDNIINKGLEAKVSDKTIKEYLIENNYSKSEIANRLIALKEKRAESIRKKEGVIDPMDNGFKATGKKILKKIFKARKLNAKSTQIAQESMDGALESQIKKAGFYTQKLKGSIKSYNGALSQKEVLSEVYKILKGEKPLERSGDLGLAKIYEAAYTQRNHIDVLTEALIESGAIKRGESIENIESNKGKYLTRAYALFDSNNWEQELLKRDDGREIINKAKEFFLNDPKTIKEAKKIAKEENEDLEFRLEILANKKVNDILRASEASDFIGVSKTGKKEVGVLKQRKQIPEAIKALMGEYTDPVQNYQRTVYKISRLLEAHKYLSKVRDAGLGVFLFEENDPTRPKGYDQKISSVDSEQYGPLAGLYTSKDILDSMSNTPLAAGVIFENPAYKWYIDKVSKVKYAKTIWSPATHGKNVFGNLFFMAQNGYIHPKEYYKASKLIIDDLFKRSSEDQLSIMTGYIDLGIINQNATLRDLQDVFKNSKSFEDTLDKAYENTNDLGKIAKARTQFAKGFKTADKFTRDIYQAEDDLFKIIAFEFEKKRRSQVIFGKSYESLNDTEAKEVNNVTAEIVKNILPNYGRVGDITKYLRIIPVAGSFASFQLESYRTAYNTINLAMNDLKSGNKRQQLEGARRLTAVLGFQTIWHVGASMLGQSIGSLFGDDEDDKITKYMKPILPSWSKNSKLQVSKIKDGIVTYTDLSGSNPHGQIDKAVNALFSKEKPVDKGLEVLSELGGSLLSKDILFTEVWAIITNEDRYGRELFTPESTVSENAETVAKNLWRAFEPGVGRTIRGINKAAQEDDKLLKEIRAQFTGFRTYDVEYVKQAGFAVSAINREVRTLKKYSAAKRQFENNEITIDELDKVYKTHERTMKEIYSPLLDLYKGAIYTGADSQEIINQMLKSGVPKYIVGQVMNGKIEYINR